MDQTSDSEIRCTGSTTAKDFFHDCPWLNIPHERRGEILIEPLYPRGRLLGGSSSPGEPKVSKLAALAAARRKKENEQTGYRPSSHSSVTLLDKLSNKSQNETHRDAKEPHNLEETKQDSTGIRSSRSINHRNKSPPKSIPVSEECNATSKATAVQEEPKPSNIVPAASPSPFAKTMLGAFQDTTSSHFESLSVVDLDFLDLTRTNSFSNAFAGPSPDDIVTSAQNSSKVNKTKKKASQRSDGDKAVNGLMKEVQSIGLKEEPKPKSKNLDVLAEFEKLKLKNAANFVVIGHVDAGKSTLMGRLLYDLKIVDQRTIDRYRKEAEKVGKSSFALAWVLDQGTEERNRGVTIDIAMNRFETSSTRFTILDAPGHRDFIPNMIAGASQADFAVLVIDASTGNFESGLKGQTKEHVLLVRSMGVQRVVVAVNKLDTVDWSQDRFEEIHQQVRAFLTTAGFQSKNIGFVPCSGLTGENIARRSDNAQASWYNGPLLVEQLESSDPATRALDKPLRLAITDVFRGGVQNPLSISGRLASGSIQTGDTVLAMPSGERATIKGVEVDNEPADWAVAGQNVILHLTDIEQKHLKPGDVICPPSSPVQNISSFSVKVLAFDHLTPMHVEVHKGRLQVPGRITQLVAALDKGTGAVMGKKRPRLVQPGSVARVVVEVETAVPLEASERVVLRAGGETVAAGLLE
ncbi:MAG: hypothetical protein Q9167_006843 [Letrouitia subvulpina]